MTKLPKKIVSFFILLSLIQMILLNCSTSGLDSSSNGKSDSSINGKSDSSINGESDLSINGESDSSINKASAAVNYGHILYQPAAKNHMEYNRAIKLANGNILATTNIRNSTNSWGIRIYRSTDNGTTFSFVTEFRDSAETKTIGCETIFEVASGNILLAYTVYDETNYSTGMKLKIQRSTNNGTSWSSVTTVENGTWNWEPEFSIASDGTLQLFYSYAGYNMSTGAQEIARRQSSDGGTTWGSIVAVKGTVGSSSLTCGMPRVTKVSNSLYYLAYELYQDSTCVHVNSGSDG